MLHFGLEYLQLYVTLNFSTCSNQTWGICTCIRVPISDNCTCTRTWTLGTWTLTSVLGPMSAQHQPERELLIYCEVRGIAMEWFKSYPLMKTLSNIYQINDFVTAIFVFKHANNLLPRSFKKYFTSDIHS